MNKVRFRLVYGQKNPADAGYTWSGYVYTAYSNGWHEYTFTPTKTQVMVQIRPGTSGQGKYFYLEAVELLYKDGTIHYTLEQDTARYQFGFNGQLKDNEIYGEGNAYSFEYRIQDPRLVRFLSVDPLNKVYPWYSPYQFAGNKTIWAIDLEGLEPKISTKDPRRIKPRITNSFLGTSGVDRMFGILGRAKYTRNRIMSSRKIEHLESNKDGSKVKIKEFPGDPSPDPEDNDVPPVDNSNPLRRDSRYGEDLKIDNRIDIIPAYKEGSLNVVFDQPLNDDGNPGERTIEVGIVDPNGKEKLLQKIKVKESGRVSIDFKLGKGESLYIRQPEGEYKGATNISGTKK